MNLYSIEESCAELENCDLDEAHSLLFRYVKFLSKELIDLKEKINKNDRN